MRNHFLDQFLIKAIHTSRYELLIFMFHDSNAANISNLFKLFMLPTKISQYLIYPSMLFSCITIIIQMVSMKGSDHFICVSKLADGSIMMRRLLSQCSHTLP